MIQPHTVVCTLEARLGREDALKAALSSVAALSRKEPTNIDYHVYQSKDNPCQFVLYENWVDAASHKRQFEKPYILELANTLKDVLASPYQGFMLQEIL